MLIELNEDQIKAIVGAFSFCESEGCGPELDRDLAIKLGMTFRDYGFPTTDEERAIIAEEQRVRREKDTAEREAREAAWNALSPWEQAALNEAERSRYARQSALAAAANIEYLRKQWGE